MRTSKTPDNFCAAESLAHTGIREATYAEECREFLPRKETCLCSVFRPHLLEGAHLLAIERFGPARDLENI